MTAPWQGTDGQARLTLIQGGRHVSRPARLRRQVWRPGQVEAERLARKLARAERAAARRTDSPLQLVHGDGPAPEPEAA